MSRLFVIPMKFLQRWCSSACFQFLGKLTRTVLWRRPPRPPAWIRCEVASRRLEEITTWLNPFTFSTSISFLRDWERWSLLVSHFFRSSALILCVCACASVLGLLSAPVVGCLSRCPPHMLPRWSSLCLLSADWLATAVEAALRSAPHPDP